MEFEEHEEQDEGIEMQLPQANYVSNTAEVARRAGGYKYKECLKNHAVGIGGNAVDGCREFMAAGEEGTLDALRCAACNCHRNFHRKQIEGETMLALQQQQYYHRPSGYLVTPMSHQRPLALPASSRELEMYEDMSNPSSSGGGGGGSKKRFRTKFTQDQKEKMKELAERLGWRIQQQDEAMVQNFCAETGIQRQVLKVWMHNNKHTLGKQLG